MSDSSPSSTAAPFAELGVVIIGRNEGARLIACLASLPNDLLRVYVDSGSTDGSVDAAKAAGAEIVALDMGLPFTAARARNAGFRRLKEIAAPRYVQFIDGDCEMAPGWIGAAKAWLDVNPQFAVACGRVREKHPAASIYNRLCDNEWDTPIGETDSCGGIALVRAAAFEAAGGFNDTLIAGEEPELCLRLREAGGRIIRLDAEMARHDAAMTKLSQWRRRAVRAGHAFAEVSHLHRRSPAAIWKAETRRALLWSAIAPASLIAALAISPAFLLALLAYPLQIARLAIRKGAKRVDWSEAMLLTLGKFAEAQGVLTFHLNRLRGKRAKIIEHKS